MADLEIFYPNGHVQANLVYIWDGTKPIPWDGSITVATSGGPIQDGVSAAIKATVFDYTNSNPLAVRLTDVAGDYVSAGGGTQYADGATQATPTGNVILWLDAANVLRAPSSTKPLPVDIKNSSLAITAASLPLPTGAATETTLASLNSKDFATQTTLALIKAKTDNLDVLLSTRALEAGGNLATVKTNTDPLVVAAAGGYIRQDSTATIAKESGGNLATLAGTVSASRAAVNLISGQAGVTAGAGVVDATTLRIALATDANTVQAIGTVADDGTTPSSPVMIGGWAKNFDGTDPGNISAEDDVVRFIADPNRRLYVNTTHPMNWSYHENSSNALTDASVKTAPGANYSLFVTDIIVSTGAATAFNIFFEEGASTILGPYYLEAVAGRGVVLHFKTPKQITANTALTVTTSAAIAHSIEVLGFIAKVN